MGAYKITGKSRFLGPNISMTQKGSFSMKETSIKDPWQSEAQFAIMEYLSVIPLH